MKKAVVVLVAAILVITSFAACTTTPQPAASSQAVVSSAAPPASSPAAVSEPAKAKTIHEETWDEITEKAKTQKLVFFIWWGEEFWNKIAADFKTKNNADVTISVGDSAVAVDKLIAEKTAAQSSFDLYAVGGGQVLTSVNGKVYEENICSLLPDADKLDPSLQKIQEGVPTNGTLIPLYRNQTGFVYNPEKVKNPPQTWEELQAWIDANPKRFGITTPDKGGSGESFFQAAMDHLTGGMDQYSGDMTADPAKIAKWDPIWQWYKDRKEKIVLTTSNSDSLIRLNSGEIWLTCLWSDDTYAAMNKGELNKNFKFYIPKLGCAGGGDTMGIIVNSQNKELALMFAAYLTSKEVQTKMADEQNVIPARTDVTVKNTVINDADMVNRTSWLPACYKVEFKKLFASKVLQ